MWVSQDWDWLSNLYPVSSSNKWLYCIVASSCQEKFYITAAMSSSMSESATTGHKSEDTREEIRHIDPSDFDNYEDYVDAYICSDDIKYLQVYQYNLSTRELCTLGIDSTILLGNVKLQANVALS